MTHRFVLALKRPLRWTQVHLGRLLIRATDVDRRLIRLRLADLGARHVELSAVASVNDSPGRPNERLLELAVEAINVARTVDVSELVRRGAPPLIASWPGEHYKLLAALVRCSGAKRVVEFGTFTGFSALAMLPELQGGRLTTIDIFPWNAIPDTILRQADFADGRLVQLVADFSDPDVARAHGELLRDADLIFIDAPKDGVFEDKLLTRFREIGLGDGTLLVMDDIRLWNMLRTWRGISHPKLDLTSFGHWSGTGLVEWTVSQDRPTGP